MNYFFVNPSLPCQSCSECAFLPDCGGLDGDDAKKGCFQRCESRCRGKACDCICPCAPVGFDEAWAEVGGICKIPQICSVPERDVFPPSYVPQIHHDGGRRKRLPEEWISIPLSAITIRSKGKLDIRFKNRSQMCEALLLSEDSRIILSCVSPDSLIEAFWKFHRKLDLLKKIANLEFFLVTVPNYSFMLDTPHINSLFNLSRIFKMTERMSEAGIPTVPHINARTKGDWTKWENFLRTLNNVNFVAMEFQTGLSNNERSFAYLQQFEQMIRKLGRPLHPLVIGGTGRLREIANICRTFTLIDSTPFFKTVNRQVLIPRAGKSRPSWVTLRTESRICLGDWLSRTIRLHRHMIYERIGISKGGEGVHKALPPAA